MSAHSSLETLSSYVDDELDDHELARVRDHVESCAECRRRLARLRRVVDQLQRLEQVAAPSALGFQVERRLRWEEGRRPFPERLEAGLGRLTRQPVLAPLFAVVIAFGAILYLFSVGVARNEGPSTRVVMGRPTASDQPARGEEARGLDGARSEGVRPDVDAGAGGESTVGSSRSQESESIERAGRRFFKHGGTWIEQGVGGEPIDAVIDLGAEQELPPGLESLRDHPGTYRLRVGGQVVDIVIPSGRS